MGMGSLVEMYFYCQQSGRYIHVSNWVGPYQGQHHVHILAGFKAWVKEVRTDKIKWLKPGRCDCGLRAGWARSGYSGKVSRLRRENG